MQLGDFTGSAINDYLLFIYYETSYKLSSKDILIKTKLFALSFTIYKVMTGLKLYKDLPDYKISTTFSKGCYFDLKSIPAFRNIIIGY